MFYDVLKVYINSNNKCIRILEFHVKCELMCYLNLKKKS